MDSTTLAGCLHPDLSEPAIILPGKNPQTISHAHLASTVKKIQSYLQSANLHSGKRVSIVLSDPYPLTCVFLATTLQGCVAAPLNHSLKQPEFEFYYEDFRADVVVLGASDKREGKESQAYLAAKASGLPVLVCSTAGDGAIDVEVPGDLTGKMNGLSVDDVDSTVSVAATAESDSKIKLQASSPALVLHTSGTTGRPKAVPLTHGNLATSIKNIVKHYSLTPADRTSLIMPLFHIHGIVCALLTPLAVGSAIIFPPPPASGVSPSFLRDAAEYKATWYTATPTLHRLVLKLPKPTSGDGPRFRYIRSCSSPLNVELLKQLEERFACVVVEAYAMTEAAHQMCSNPVSSSRREGSVGVSTGMNVAILDDDGRAVEAGKVGEVCVKGENVMSGYANNEEANKKSFVEVDGSRWLRTGDQGRLEKDGFLVLTGRIKELINKGGEKIGPVEIDNVLNRHEGVAEAVAFAMPDEMYGEEVAAAVVLEQSHELTEKEIKDWVKKSLAAMKVPKRVFFVDEIPKTSVGKMQRSLVAQKLLNG